MNFSDGQRIYLCKLALRIRERKRSKWGLKINKILLQFERTTMPNTSYRV